MPESPTPPATVCTTTVRLTANAAIVAFFGPMDCAALASSRESVESALAARPDVVVADLTRAVLTVESLALLAQLHRRVTLTGARFALAGLSTRARALLAAARVTPPYLVYPAVPTAPPWADSRPAAYI